jgi:tRNA uridine 5-carboxymethylaminomethyl modification enzyme
MLTSRSEHRLTLREGNADLRLAATTARLGLLEAGQRARTEQRRADIARERHRLERLGLASRLRSPPVSYAALAPMDRDRPHLPLDVVEEVEAEIKYAGYVSRAERRHSRLLGGPDAPIPEGLSPTQIRGLSREAQDIPRPVQAHHPRRRRQTPRTDPCRPRSAANPLAATCSSLRESG